MWPKLEKLLVICDHYLDDRCHKCDHAALHTEDCYCRHPGLCCRPDGEDKDFPVRCIPLREIEDG